MCAELHHCQRWVTNREWQRVPQWRTRDGKTSLSVGCRLRSRYRQIAACCGTEMTSSADRYCTPNAAEWAASAVDLGCRWWCGRTSVCAVSVKLLHSARTVVAGYELHAHRAVLSIIVIIIQSINQSIKTDLILKYLILKYLIPGSRDSISKIWDPLITFERIEQSAYNMVQ